MPAEAPFEAPSAGEPRTSSYTIYCDLADDREHVLLVHGYSGAFDVVGRDVAAYLRSRDTQHPPKPLYGQWSTIGADGAAVRTPSDATLAHLRRRAYLTTRTVAEEEAFFARHADALHAAALRQMPTYVIMPTYDCNLRCGYCFQDHMRTDPAFSPLLRVMTPATADRIVAALPHFESRHGVEPAADAPRRIVFFGGEPLYGGSRAIVEYLIERIRAAGPAVFAAVSNGTQLDRFAHLIGPGAIEDLQITLDGPPARHDARRIHADGAGSFAAIAANVTLALERGARIDIRMNVDRANLADLPALAAIFAERGWTAFPNFSSHAEPVTDSGARASGRRAELLNSHELDVEIAALREKFPAMTAIGVHDDALAQRALRIFGRTGSATLPTTAAFCGAHTGMYILDAFGDVYACWERTGDRNLRIGWIDDAGAPQFVADRLANWRARTVTSNPTCRRCRFALYCGGGCAVLAEASNGATIHANYCDAFGKRFRTKIAQAYERHRAEPLAAQPAECR